MIIICEPLCKEMSHEKVNSGFIYGLSLAFPDEKIRLYADSTHIEAIKKILAHDKIYINHIEYRSISFGLHSTFIEVIRYYFLFYQMFAEVVILGADKIFFLSFSPTILYVIKKLKEKTNFVQLKFTFVLHGAFESIADDTPLYPGIILPRNEIPVSIALEKKSFLEKICQTRLSEIPMKIWNRIIMHLPVIHFPWPKFLLDFFTVKKMMEWNHSADYRYVALSPHVTRNAAKYIDTEKFNLYTVILPTFFVAPTPSPINDHVKFAIFGYGNSLVLHNVAYKLSQKKINKSYEIRIIGMDNRGTEDFVNVTCTSKGERLERDEMEKHAKDIDAFLILYDKTKYRLSCSGSILESLSYTKPMIHFDNDCINQFNKMERPIGIRCDSFDEYVNKLEDIIENYDSYKTTFLGYRANILKLREECAIEKSVPDLRESFNW
jgi:hypothetical protein